MLETYNNQELIVRNYVDNFSVKDYVTNHLIGKYFPNIPMNKLNLGFVGLVTEYLSQAIEDSYYTSSLMLNENFITRAILPDSIYSEAALFDLGYTFATASKCNFALQLWTEDVIKYSTKRSGSSIYEYKLDRDTQVIIGDNVYRLDYDIIISHQYMNGKPVFEVQYDMEWNNSIAITKNRYIKNRVFNNGWIVLFVTMQEFERIVIDETITDNTITTASDIVLEWDNHLAGFDITYITPYGERLPMKKKIMYSDPDVEPYIYYKFTDDNQIKCSFTEALNFFKPAFNSTIEFTLYTCHGVSANFDMADPKAQVIVEKSGDKYEYNVDTHIVAVCYSGSLLGTDRKDIEMLRDDVKMAYNTAKVLSTDHDLDEWFNNYAKRYDTKAYFFKRRDDPSGRLFSQFIAITDKSYIYPTNTLNIEVKHNQFDFVNGSNEFILKPGHLWKYKPGSRDTIIPLGTDASTSITASNGNGKAMITDEDIPVIDDLNPDLDERFMFVNPFYIKINRIPGISACYNYLIHDTSSPVETYHNTKQFLHFQILNITVDRSIEKSNSDNYKVTAKVAPVTEKTMISDDYEYIQGTSDLFPELKDNNLRVLMVTKTKMLGETGYIEMKPTSIDESGFIVFESNIKVNDNLRNDNTIEIIDNEMISLVKTGPTAGRKFIDSAESMIDFIILIKSDKAPSLPIYNDPSFQSDIEPFKNMYEIANRFSNNYRELNLYKPMGMMRSIITFSGSDAQYEYPESGSDTVDIEITSTNAGAMVYKYFLNDDGETVQILPSTINNYIGMTLKVLSPVYIAGGYTVKAELMPFIKYDIALNNEKMTYFIQAFNEQYAVIEPVLFERLDNNCHLDMKFFNTYGKSNNYYLGDSNELLESVRIRITFRISVKDRSSYLVTAESIINQIKDFFMSLNDNKINNVYISNLIKELENKNLNLDHLKFIKINDSTPYNQYIRYKYKNFDTVDSDNLRTLVPELLMIESEDITLIEESGV